MEIVRPCCRDCNYMKFKSSYHDFINKCREICAHNKISVSVVCDTTDIPVIEPPIENVFISTIQVNTDDLVVIQPVIVENRRQLEISANIQLEMETETETETEPEDTSKTTALVAKSTTKTPNTKIPKTKTPKTKEEICEDAKKRKQLQIKRLKELHGEDVFKEMQAKKMAEYRKQKKEKINTQDQPK